MATPKVWRTKEGKEIPIRELGDRHLVCAANLMLRKARELIQDAATDAWEISASVQGEMASYYADRDAQALQEATCSIQGIVEEIGDTQALFKAVLAEVRRRKLDLEDPKQPGQFVRPEVTP